MHIYQNEVNTKENYNQLFNDKNEPSEELTLEKIVNVETKIQKIKRHNSEKKQLITNIEELKAYFLLKEEINQYYSNKTLSSNISLETIDKLEEKYNNLSEKYQKYLETDLIDLKSQKNYLDSLESEILELFTDESKTAIKEDVTLEKIESCRQKLALLNESDFAQSKNNDLNIATDLVNKKNEAINNAWVILNVPYISQNNNNVLNGCEAACLLMGLQYKGYLKDTTLYQLATDMPKSENNAYEGFTHDIFGLEPTNVPHWIAPSALAPVSYTHLTLPTMAVV